MTDPDRPLPPFRRWLVTQVVVGVVAVFVLLDGLIGILGATSQWKIMVGTLAVLFWARTAVPEGRRYRAERSVGSGSAPRPKKP